MRNAGLFLQPAPGRERRPPPPPPPPRVRRESAESRRGRGDVTEATSPTTPSPRSRAGQWPEGAARARESPREPRHPHVGQQRHWPAREVNPAVLRALQAATVLETTTMAAVAFAELAAAWEAREAWWGWRGRHVRPSSALVGRCGCVAPAAAAVEATQARQQEAVVVVAHRPRPRRPR